jgi:FkbM family methyltransferase
LEREIIVALPGGETDPYVSQFRRAYPFPVVLQFLIGSRKGIRSFVDVGANFGHMTLAASAMELECLAVEPDPASYVLLCTALAENGFSSARPIHAAATDRPDVLMLTGGSAYGQVHASDEGTNGTRVPGLPLDTLLAQHDVRSPDLIKIDVEGHEPEVIRGLERTLKVSRPLLIVESNTSTLGGVRRTRHLLATIEDYGYELNLFLADGSVTPRPSDVLQPTAVADYLAIPEGRLRKALPRVRSLSLDEEVEAMNREPLQSPPHLLHLCHAIAAIREREPGISTRLDPLRKRIVDLGPTPLEFVHNNWDSEFACWLRT